MLTDEQKRRLPKAKLIRVWWVNRWPSACTRRFFITRRTPMTDALRTLANGVFIEDNGSEERKPSDRCFRFDANGNAEYALFADLTGSNPAPRWFGHQFRERDFTFA